MTRLRRPKVPLCAQILAGFSRRRKENSFFIRAKLQHNARVITPDVALSVIVEDPDDDRVIECAVSAETKHIVTGDRHLLKIGSYASIQIMSVRQFMDFLEPAL